jgi:Oxidoreductase-like protein, N-terminal
MSGCVHCVWDDYRDEVESWAVRLRQVQLQAQGVGMDSPKVGMSRPEVADASVSMDDDGGGSEALWDSALTVAPGEDLFQGIPVGIREFMATEKRLKDRRKKKKTLENDYD